MEPSNQQGGGRRRPLITLGIVLTILIGLALGMDPLLNAFARKPIMKALHQAWPNATFEFSSLHYSLLKNRFVIDSLSFAPEDSSFTGTIGSTGIRGFHWLALLSGDSASLKALAAADIDAGPWELRSRKLQYSVAIDNILLGGGDSTVLMENLRVGPLRTEAQFFGASKFQRTLYTVDCPHVDVRGFYRALVMSGGGIKAGTMTIDSLALDILVNKTKPSGPNRKAEPMPNELLAQTGIPVSIDSIALQNAKVQYRERFSGADTTAIIRFHNLEAWASNFSNDASRQPFTVTARTMIMESGRLAFMMEMDLSREQFAVRYKGNAGPVNLTEFNPWMDPAERVRFISGRVDTIWFDLKVVHGAASGSVHAGYHDLRIQVHDRATGSAKGVENSVATFVANTFKIRDDSRDGEQPFREGKSDYSRQPGDTFWGVLWQGLRSGLLHLAGL